MATLAHWRHWPECVPASTQKESGPASHSSRVRLDKGCKAGSAAVPKEHKHSVPISYIPCTDWTNLCYLLRNPVFSFTNRKSLMLGSYFKHALKLWVFSRKNESLPITLTCYSTNGTNSGDKSEHVWAELFKKTLDQPSKILFYGVRPTLYSAAVKAIRWFKWLLYNDGFSSIKRMYLSVFNLS